MGMEARLFLFSIWCGVYGQIVRLAFRREGMTEKTWFVMVMDGLFWGSASMILGMLVASYADRFDDMTRLLVLFFGVGLVAGALVGWRKARRPDKREDLLKDNLEWADTGFSAILLAAFVMFFIVQAFKIPSASMRQTFLEGDHLFVNKFIYGIPIPLTDKKVLPFTKVAPGDIVIFRFPADDKDNPHYGKDFIKRAIAVGGQTVEIINKQVFVDGRPIEEPYKQHVDDIVFPSTLDVERPVYQRLWEQGEFAREGGNEVRDNFGPVVVPPGHVLVMGDNRDRSFDSRYWGPLEMSAVKGKAWLLYLPIRRFRLVE